MKVMKIIISITIPFFLIILFASVLTTKPYLMLSKGRYYRHSQIEFDHDYAVDRIIGYLNYRYDDLIFGSDEFDPIPIMEEEDLIHMKDVKDVYTGLRLGALGSLIIGVSLSIVMFRKDKKEFYKTYKYIYLGPILFASFVGAYILIDFNTAFTVFHSILFPQGGWELEYNSALLQLLPTQFWMVSGVILMLLFSSSMGLIYVLNEKIMKKHMLN